MNYILQGQGHLSKRSQVPSAARVQQHSQSANEHDPDDHCDFGDVVCVSSKQAGSTNNRRNSMRKQMGKQTYLEKGNKM